MPRDRSVPLGHAEDRARRARVGRAATAVLYYRDDADVAVINRGAMLAADGPPGRYGRGRSLRQEQRVVDEGRTLHVTLAADIFEQDDPQVEEDAELLLSLSERDGFTVSVNGSDVATGWPKISRSDFTVELAQDNPGLVDVPALVEMLRETGERPSGFVTVAQAMHHRRSDGELFVTCDANLLSRRYSSSGIFARMGVVDPSEAVTLAFAIQRGRGVYALDSPGSHAEFGESGYFFALTRVHLPQAMAAYRTALDPSRGGTADSLSEHLDAIFEKYHSLLVAMDDCGRLHLSEGYFGGGYTTLGRYRTLIHESVVLLAGIMDIVAHIAIERSGKSASSPTQISWRHLVRADNGPYRNLSGEAKGVQDAASTQPLEELEYLAEVRHLYAHRKSIPGYDSSYFSGDGSVHYAKYCVLDLGRAADERGSDLPEEFLGSFCDGKVQPFLVQMRIVELAANLIEAVGAALDQSSPNWWGTGEGLESLAVDELHARRWWRQVY